MRHVLAVACALGLCAGAVQATVLTFEPHDLFADLEVPEYEPGHYGLLIPADYGSNAVHPNPQGYIYGNPDTPNVTVGYAPQSGSVGVRFLHPKWVQDGMGTTGSLSGVIYNDQGILPGASDSSKWQITFTAEPEYLVTLESLDLAGMATMAGAQAGTTIIVYADGVQAFEESFPELPILPDDGPDAQGYIRVLPNVTGQVVVLEFNDHFVHHTVVDNIAFSQMPVPEPATLSLLALAGLAMLRRRG